MAFRTFRVKLPKRLRRKKLTLEQKLERDQSILRQTHELKKRVKGIPSPLLVQSRIIKLKRRRAVLVKRRRQAQTAALITRNKSVKLVQRSKAINTTRALGVNASALKQEGRLLQEAKHAAPIKKAIAPRVKKVDKIARSIK